MELIILTCSIFFVGLFIGSFLHVVADRIISGESIFFGRSHCDSCKKELTWKELLPVISFLLQKGKCRQCNASFSLWYPLSEIATGVVFAFTFLVFMSSSLMTLLLLFVLVAVLMIIFLIDAKYGLIPFPLVIISLVLASGFLFLQEESFFTSLKAASIIGGFFLAIFVLTRGKGMGFGDVVYAFFMGWFLGFPGIIVGLYLAFLTGAVVSLILVLLKRKKLRGDTIAFGPFLVMGTLLAFIFEDYFIALFTGLF